MKSETRHAIWSYITGFILSLIFTGTAYLFVIQHVNSGHVEYSHRVLLVLLLLLAVIQLYVQMVFFLHLDREKKPKLNLMSFLFAVGVVLIVVIGSIWIMNNLNYNMMSPQQTDQYLIHDEGVHR